MWWIKATTLRFPTFLYIRGKEIGENLNQLSWRITQPKFCFIRQQIKCHDCKFNNKENPKSPCLSYICFSTLLKRPRFEIYPFFSGSVKNLFLKTVENVSRYFRWDFTPKIVKVEFMMKLAARRHSWTIVVKMRSDNQAVISFYCFSCHLSQSFHRS